MAETVEEKMRKMHQKALKEQEKQLVETAKHLYEEISWANSQFFNPVEMPVYELAEKVGGEVKPLAKNLWFKMSAFLKKNPYPEYPLEFEEIFKLMVKMEKALRAYNADLELED